MGLREERERGKEREREREADKDKEPSIIHFSEPTRPRRRSYDMLHMSKRKIMTIHFSHLADGVES